jgi:hypothetical protein
MRFYIKELYYIQATVDISKFMSNVFGEFVAIKSGSICFNNGFTIQDILGTIEVSMKFRDCYKTILSTLTDYTNWTQSPFSLLDKCSDSDDENITLYTWNPIKADTTTYWVGGSSFSPCYPGKVLSPNVHNALFNTLTTLYGGSDAT